MDVAIGVLVLVFGALGVAAATVALRRPPATAPAVEVRVAGDGGIEAVQVAPAGVEAAAVAVPIKAVVGCIVVGLLLAFGAILLQGKVAEGNAQVKAYETATTECVKKAEVWPNTTPDAWPDACADELDAYETQTSATARYEGFRTLAAAVGLSLIGYGLGDLWLKKRA